MKHFFLPAAATLALCTAACGDDSPVSDQAGKSGSLPSPETVNTSSPSGAAPPANASTQPTPGNAASDSGETIPASLQGRWGLTPQDCTSTRGDAKGLLTVGPRELVFYESRGVPAGNVEARTDSFSADFAFTGEGMKWTKFQSLQLRDGNLVRTESTPMASYTYARCD